LKEREREAEVLAEKKKKHEEMEKKKKERQDNIKKFYEETTTKVKEVMQKKPLYKEYQEKFQSKYEMPELE